MGLYIPIPHLSIVGKTIIVLKCYGLKLNPCVTKQIYKLDDKMFDLGFRVLDSDQFLRLGFQEGFLGYKL